MSFVDMCVGHVNINNSLLTRSLTIWLFNSSPWNITMLLIGKLSISMRHLFPMAMLVITRGLWFPWCQRLISTPCFTKVMLKSLRMKPATCHYIIWHPLKTKPPKINIPKTTPRFGSGGMFNVTRIIIRHHSIFLNSAVICYLNME